LDTVPTTRYGSGEKCGSKFFNPERYCGLSGLIGLEGCKIKTRTDSGVQRLKNAIPLYCDSDNSCIESKNARCKLTLNPFDKEGFCEMDDGYGDCCPANTFNSGGHCCPLGTKWDFGEELCLLVW